MITLFVIIKKLLKFLNSNESVQNIAFSATMAVIFSLLPFNAINHFFLLLILIIFNGNLFIFIFLTPIFELFSNSFYPLFHEIGQSILTTPSLKMIFNNIYQLPIVNFTNWNNTITMGGLIFCLIIAIPLFMIYKLFLTKYRKVIMPLIQKSKLRHIFKIPSWLGRLDK